jgi:CheY-like chemotaxis protein
MSPSSRSRPEAHRVLVVDGDHAAASQLRDAFLSEGYEVALSPTGGEAIVLAISWRPTLVVMDVSLPDIDGLEVIRVLRKHSSVAIIALSARDSESEKIATLDRGANDFVCKPPKQLDQFVTIFERLPDTVQQDHIDWGFRVSPLFGETYRYTTSLGILSDQLQKWNKFAGFDAPMIYGEMYVPGIFEGLMLRLGRFISVPDIEAQLAPNNYMYSHSMTYGYDNYTTTGLISTWQLTKNWMVQAGILVGTDSNIWNGRQVHYPALPANTVYSITPGIWNVVPAGYLSAGQAAYNGQNDNGIQPSFTGCIRYQTDNAYNAVYSCANALNTGGYGYNNLQQFTTTFYHKFNDQWHFDVEFWHMHTDSTPNFASPLFGATPYPWFHMLNGYNGAICQTDLNSHCTAREWSILTYLNWEFSPQDNLSWRAEYFNDITGQRTGFKTSYFNYAMGWQHWLTPTITVRPEVAFYNSLKTPAFENGTHSHATIFSADLIWHY